MTKREVGEMMDTICKKFDLHPWKSDTWSVSQRKSFTDCVSKNLLYDVSVEKSFFRKLKKEWLSVQDEEAEFRGNSTLLKDVKSGLADYLELKEEDDGQNIPEALKNLIGNWYSFVRASWNPDIILKTPVKIDVSASGIEMTMKNENRSYTGILRLASQCVRVQLVSDDGKKEYTFILKIGHDLQRTHLVGLFSGVNSDGNIVAGVEFLQKTNPGLFKNLKAEKFSLETFLNAPEAEDRQIALFLKNHDPLVTHNFSLY